MSTDQVRTLFWLGRRWNAIVDAPLATFDEVDRGAPWERPWACSWGDSSIRITGNGATREAAIRDLAQKMALFVTQSEAA
jgi:hypothetical protein